jgi:magnesium transporter
VVGVGLALAFFPAAWLLGGQSNVAVAGAVLRMAGCSIATMVAMALPWLFHRLGSDPAFGSGPLATVIQDLLSIVLYFVICIRVVGLAA